MLVEANDLNRRFGEVTALDALNLSLPEGAIGLIGPNGAGKTTLLRILMGLIPPTSGTARVFGRDCGSDGLAIRERVGYMPEHECLIPEMTGVGFVAYMGRVSGLEREAAFQRAHEILQFVGLREERYRKISEYSVGMRQRVKLAQALVHDPPLCFLDEPTAGLDPGGRESMIELLRVLASRSGRSLVLSTHLLGDIERVCDEVVMLDSGRLLAAGKLVDLRSSGKDELKVRVKGDVERFASELAARGAPGVRDGLEITLPRPSGGERVIFEAAAASGAQLRYLGPSVRTMDELFRTLVRAKGEGRTT